MPTWPLKSASPRPSMRPVSVTSPAPVITPRIPSRGRVDTSDGMAAAAARAMSIADGRTVMFEAAIGFRSLSRADGCNYGESGTQLRGESRVLECDFDGNTLDDLGEVARGIVGRQESELRPARRCDLQHLAAEYLPGVLVNPNLGSVANLHVGQLGFAIVCLYPLGATDEGNRLC